MAFAGTVLVCSLGRGGIHALKREGDGATPRARMPLIAMLWRSERGLRPVSALPGRRIHADDGWCDATCDGRYNRFVKTPFAASHERLAREDALYNVLIVLGWNLRPRVAGHGSAIFLHVAKRDTTTQRLKPTEGCIALPEPTLRRLLARLPARCEIVVA